MTLPTLQQILASEDFYTRVRESAHLSKRGNESSFCVYLTPEQEVVYTTPLEEYEDSAEAGKDESGGVYHIKGHGLYMPENAIPLVDLHFHPPSNAAVPSAADLFMNFTQTPGPSEGGYADGTLRVNPVSIVGHYNKGVITLFLGQFSLQGMRRCDGVSIKDGEPLTRSISDRIYEELGQGDEQELNFNDSQLPFRAAEVLNNDGDYQCFIVRFRTKGQYNKGLKDKINSLSLKAPEFIGKSPKIAAKDYGDYLEYLGEQSDFPEFY